MFRVAFISRMIHLVTERTLFSIVFPFSSSIIAPSMTNIASFVICSLILLIGVVNRNFGIDTYVLIEVSFLL